MKKNSNLSLVTIGIPIYNEERFISETLDSVINQDYANIEIHISDNASTDKTGSICLEYAKKYNWIQYHRHQENIGAVNNFFHLTSKARGDYFVWMSGHDKWSSNLLSECVKLLDKTPSATIAYGTPVWIDEAGEHLQKNSGWYDTRGCNPTVRFFAVFWGSMNPVLGVIRWQHMPDLSRNRNFVGNDLALLTELALRGEFIHAKDAVFYRRQNRPPEEYRDKLNRYKSEDTQITNNLFSRLFPLTKLPIELLRNVIQADIHPIDKIFIIILLIPSLPIKYILGKRDNKLGP